MPHLDYLTYLSQIFWFLLFFWLAYSLFFFIFLPKLYYSFRIRKLKFDFLFDKYVSSEYKINFYNFFFKEHSEQLMSVFFAYLKLLKSKYTISLTTSYKRARVISLFANLFLNDLLYFYWSKGIALNFSVFLGTVLFSDWKKSIVLNKINRIYLSSI